MKTSIAPPGLVKDEQLTQGLAPLATTQRPSGAIKTRQS